MYMPSIRRVPGSILIILNDNKRLSVSWKPVTWRQEQSQLQNVVYIKYAPEMHINQQCPYK
jgi:hypothetical protein